MPTTFREVNDESSFRIGVARGLGVRCLRPWPFAPAMAQTNDKRHHDRRRRKLSTAISPSSSPAIMRRSRASSRTRMRIRIFSRRAPPSRVISLRPRSSSTTASIMTPGWQSSSRRTRLPAGASSSSVSSCTRRPASIPIFGTILRPRPPSPRRSRQRSSPRIRRIRAITSSACRPSPRIAQADHREDRRNSQIRFGNFGDRDRAGLRLYGDGARLQDAQ